MIVRATSQTTGRAIAYLIGRDTKNFREADDRQEYARRYGLFIAAKQADGTWLNRLGELYVGGTNLDAQPFADDVGKEISHG